MLSRCSVWAASLLLPSCGVRSNRCGFHFNPLIPQPFESEMAFHCCWSLISILRVCPHFYADELFLVCFASYYLLKSPYTSKPNFSEDPSACLTARLSLPCGTERPVCRLQPAPPSLRLPPCQVHGQYFRHGVMGGALLTETPLPPAPPFLTPLLSPVSPVSLSPLPAHACPVSVRIHQCSAAGSPVLILCPFSGRQMHVCNLLFPALPRVSDLYIQLSRHIHVELSKSLLKPPV